MKRILSLFIQDMLIAYRSGHIFITGILLVVMIALVLLLPKELKVHQELVLDATSEGALAGYLQELGLGNDVVFTDKEAFQTAQAKSPNKVGVIFTGGLAAPHFEIISSGSIVPANLGLLEASLDRAIQEMRGTTPRAAQGETSVQFLRPLTSPPPFNLHMIPIMIVFEVVLLGFFIAAVMMFQEKQEATLRAYRVTPGGSLAYVLSKTALFLVLSLVYGLPILLAGFGFQAHYPILLTLLMLSSGLMTLFSLAVAVFFRNLSEWFFVGVAILVINSLPMISYGLPGFAPTWLTWVPSYPAVFAFRDVLFHQAGWPEIQGTLGYLALLTALAFAGAYAAVALKLMQEGR